MEFKMSDRTYNILKWAAQVVLPALITFYGVVGSACRIPYLEETLTVLGALDAFLGTVLGISTANYKATLKNVQQEQD